MKKMHRWIYSLVGICLSLNMTTAFAEDHSIQLKVGQIKVVPISNIARVAVGDSKVLNAVTDDDKEVVLFARQEGETTVQVWDANEKRITYNVVVDSSAMLRVQDDIRRTINRIPNVHATVVGQKVIVEGDKLTDADRERVHLLAKHYPQIIDMTSQVGWDQMVMLDVQILEIPRSFLQELGVKWQTSSVGGLNSGVVWDSVTHGLDARPGEQAIAAGLGAATRPLGYFGVNALLSSTLNVMANEGKAVMLAQPQLMARSGATAEFLAGGEVPYSVSDGLGNTQTVFKPYGVSLHITPRIERNGIIRSQINVEVSSIDGSMVLEGGPALKIRRTSTEFNVRSGQTLVLSGFISRDQMQNLDKVPGMADMPILGALFKSKKFQNNETELAIFVRPVVVSADNPDMKERVQRSKAIVDSSFEQGPLINVKLEGDPIPVDSGLGTELTPANPNFKLGLDIFKQKPAPTASSKWQVKGYVKRLRKIPLSDLTPIPMKGEGS